MERIEITPATIDRFDDVAEDLTKAYQIAFAYKDEFGGWGEVSKCINEPCSKGFCEDPVGSTCSGCGSTLVEAYDAVELVSGWRNMLLNEDAFMEIALNQNRQATSATIARPTNCDELLLRKYADNESMAEWITNNLPRNFTWIEDTFANRELQPSGNLAARGRTLARIALRYAGDDIATRTIAPQIIGATARDVGTVTDLYVGTENIGLGKVNQFRSSGTIPDWRSALVIDGKELL